MPDEEESKSLDPLDLSLCGDGETAPEGWDGIETHHLMLTLIESGRSCYESPHVHRSGVTNVRHPGVLVPMRTSKGPSHRCYESPHLHHSRVTDERYPGVRIVMITIAGSSHDFYGDPYPPRS